MVVSRGRRRSSPCACPGRGRRWHRGQTGSSGPEEFVEGESKEPRVSNRGMPGCGSGGGVPSSRATRAKNSIHLRIRMRHCILVTHPETDRSPAEAICSAFQSGCPLPLTPCAQRPTSLSWTSTYTARSTLYSTISTPSVCPRVGLVVGSTCCVPCVDLAAQRRNCHCRIRKNGGW